MNTTEIKRILPSYPLFVKDPVFSIWSNSERLNDSNVTIWYGLERKLLGFLRIDGEIYCFLGRAEDYIPFGVKKAEQTSLSVRAFSTDYQFVCGSVTLSVRFLSPLPLNDLKVLSCPVCYMEYEIEGAEGKSVEISLFLHRSIAYNPVQTQDKQMRALVVPCGEIESAGFGLKRQLVMSSADDLATFDWGYYYLAGEKAYALDEKDLFSYLASGKRAFTNTQEEAYIGAINESLSNCILMAYDDILSIEYFGEYLKGYYLSEHTVFEGIEETYRTRKQINEKLLAFEQELILRAQPYGEEYLRVLYASLRQSIAAHKLVFDGKGNLLFLSKECCSNGCIGTVDVSYPSMPLYLLYDAELVKGMMRPVLKFAKMPVWNFDFAPHDVGTYPICSGQVYGLNRESSRYHGNFRKRGLIETHYPNYLLPASFDAFDFNMQMPVEECANLLIMFLACYERDGDISFFAGERDLCAKWVEYLVKYGLKPNNQLCTDDFAGHLRNNVNLTIKATVAIGCYAKLLEACGEDGSKYRAIAERFAEEVSAFAEGKTHLPITWDLGEDTFSLKYNFAFDKILGLGLFKRELLEREVAYCLTKENAFGIPLDNRKQYTKSDWLLWTASLTEDMEKRKKIIKSVDFFLQNSPDRTPFSDWYETEDGKHHMFTNRSVQGGCFILLLQ